MYKATKKQINRAAAAALTISKSPLQAMWARKRLIQLYKDSIKCGEDTALAFALGIARDDDIVEVALYALCNIQAGDTVQRVDTIWDIVCNGAAAC